MNKSIRSLLSLFWPVLGSLYLVYLALQPPPSRYVGLGGLVVVTPLLVGWAVGHLFGVGPWAPDSDADEANHRADEAAPAATESAPNADGEAPDTDEDAPDAGAAD